ncbi:MAG TPA: amidophosphoribosyltransferase, partial [Deltaproteobacteria bacterium]|nr:amidophosphoribosyltransferase [Deltaproteobacteria bacterium]
MCGIFGINNHKEAANITYLGLHALQHRGQESAGIASTDGYGMKYYKQMGLVSDVFGEDTLKNIKGTSAIGHVRYSTAGSSNISNAQPIVVEFAKNHIAVAHNGNLTNAKIIKETLENYGSIFQTTTDTEVIVHLMALSNEKTILDRLINALHRIEGAYSLLLLADKEIIAARDPYGFRPLVIGKLKKSFVISSESCAFDLIEAEYIREIEPGEVVYITKDGLLSVKPFKKVTPKYCIFEFIYFARPDSFMFG